MDEDYYTRKLNAEEELPIMMDMMYQVWKKHEFDDRWKVIPLPNLDEEIIEEYNEWKVKKGDDTHECISLALTAMMKALRNMRGEEKEDKVTWNWDCKGRIYYGD